MGPGLFLVGPLYCRLLCPTRSPESSHTVGEVVEEVMTNR